MTDKNNIDEYSYTWPPLESDPLIFNKYFQDVGLPDYLGFQELLTLNPKEIELQFSDFPILGVIAAVNRSKIEYNQENILKGSIPFYIKQTRELDNACGLIAALHLLGNYKDEITLPENSILKRFFVGVSGCEDYEKAKYLENFVDLKLKHQEYANMGQSYSPYIQTPQDNIIIKERRILHHFTSYANVDNKLLELDGTLPGPLIIKNKITDGNLLKEVVEEINQKISKGIIGEDLSILFLTYI